MKALVVSHAHPTFSIGGAQVASYNLFQGLKGQGWDAHYLAGVGPPVARHRATPLMSLGQGPDETLFWSDDFDWFYLGSKDIGGLTQHFERFLADCRPDVVNFHHAMGFGVQALRAVRRALGDVPVVFTLHEYLMICANHGQMIKARTGALCSKASPSECGVCFPEVGPANLMRRELFIKSFLAEVDAFVSPRASCSGASPSGGYRGQSWSRSRMGSTVARRRRRDRSRRGESATDSLSSANSTRSRGSACSSTR